VRSVQVGARTVDYVVGNHAALDGAAFPYQRPDDSMPTPSTVIARALSPWQAFARRVLYDYPPRAQAAWLAITVAGAVALGWAAWQLAFISEAAAWPLALALGLVALASSLSIKLPRSEYSLSIGDVFVFGVLATLGPAAAVLASGVDALAGTMRTPSD
jgi:hypothetical protein